MIQSIIINKVKFRLLVVALSIGIVHVIGFALPTDREQIVQLRAGMADLNQKLHRGTYSNTVEFDQGTTHIRAAEAITEGNSNNQLTLAIAKGNKEAQAHFWTQPALDKPLLHAYADTITYYPDQHIIELTGNAHVQQGDNAFFAPKIRYDTVHQHMISTKSNNQNNKYKRTMIIIHPEKRA